MLKLLSIFSSNGTMFPKVFTYFLTLFLISRDKCLGNTELHNEEVFGDEGSNLIVPCSSTGYVMWRRQGRDDSRAGRMKTYPNNTLSITDLIREDSGIYTCIQDDNVINRVFVKVRTPPPALVNVTVVPSTILAFLHWEVEDTGGYPITHFTAQYRLKHTQPNQPPDPWHSVIPIEINPIATQIDIYQLEPNSSYVFQIWGNNKLGRGDVVELAAVTLHDAQEIELAKHLLDGAATFDTRVWVAAVAVVMGTLIVLASATIYLLYKECHVPLTDKEAETLELIPNIILNPGYISNEWTEADENCNDRIEFRINNNIFIHPVRM